MTQSKESNLYVAPEIAGIFASIDLTAESIFTHEKVVAWRTLPDRQNCTLDLAGRRFHVKRYTTRKGAAAAEKEIVGTTLLADAHISTADLVAHGNLRDGRAFTIFADLAGYAPADKLLAQGIPFARVLDPTATLAARLHNARLHHRDLYLCHFMAKVEDTTIELRLIDTARVKHFNALTRRRWIVKDLAQFLFSTREHQITDADRDAWLEKYAAVSNLRDALALHGAVERKIEWIANHDRSLRRKQPSRNVSIPGT